MKTIKTPEEILREYDVKLHPDDPWSDKSWDELCKHDAALIACLDAIKAYHAQFEQWNNIASKEPELYQQLWVFSLITNDVQAWDYTDRDELKYFKHWMPFYKPTPPTED